MTYTPDAPNPARAPGVGESGPPAPAGGGVPAKEPKSASRRNRFDVRQATIPIVLGLALLLAGNLAFYALMVRPRVQEFQAVSQEGSPRIQALQAKRERVEKLETFVIALQKARDDLKTLRTDVLSTRSKRMVEVQSEVERLCRDFNIALELVNYDYPDLPAEQLEGVRMIVPLQGGYAALRKFLNAVEESEKFLLVERVVLAHGLDGGVMLQLNITLTTYFDAPTVERV
jgi:hypothetical protein